MNKVGIIGAGTIGSTIALAAALRGYSIVVYDIYDAILAESKRRISKINNTGIEKKKIESSAAKAAADFVATI